MHLDLTHLKPSQRHLIGVSGGRDSVALLHALHQAGFAKLIVCHVNHKLRGAASNADARFTQKLAESLGYPFETCAVEVAKEARATKESLEACGRRVRHEFFARVAKQHRCPRVILAHHADDQAETVLLRLLRGTGLAGLAGMCPCTTMRIAGHTLTFIRPLLAMRRAGINAFVQEHGIAFREDASNNDTQHARNQARLELLPLLQEITGRDPAAPLVNLARIAARDDDCLHAVTAEMIEREGLFATDGALLLKPSLKGSHPAVQHRVLHGWLKARRIGDISTDLIEQAVRLITQRDPARMNLPGGAQLRRKAGALRVVKL